MYHLNFPARIYSIMVGVLTFFILAFLSLKTINQAAKIFLV